MEKSLGQRIAESTIHSMSNGIAFSNKHGHFALWINGSADESVDKIREIIAAEIDENASEKLSRRKPIF